MNTKAPGSNGSETDLTGPALTACNRLYEKRYKPEDVSALTYRLEISEVQKDQLRPGDLECHGALARMSLLKSKPLSPEYAAFYAAQKAQERERAEIEAQNLLTVVDELCKEFATGNMSINSLVMEVWKTVGGDEKSKAAAEEWYDRRCQVGLNK